MTLDQALVTRCGGRARSHAPLASWTTFGVGGPADWLVEARCEAEVVDLVHGTDR
jgi:UDP-N-acetylenolpyruvoylglucosamine reductase